MKDIYIRYVIKLNPAVLKRLTQAITFLAIVACQMNIVWTSTNQSDLSNH